MCSKIGNVGEGSSNVVDLIRAGKVDPIINKPEARQGRRDGYEIRRAAVDFSVPYITNDLRLAVAAGDAITVAAGKDGIGVKSIRESGYP